MYIHIYICVYIHIYAGAGAQLHAVAIASVHVAAVLQHDPQIGEHQRACSRTAHRAYQRLESGAPA